MKASVDEFDQFTHIRQRCFTDARTQHTRSMEIFYTKYSKLFDDTMLRQILLPPKALSELKTKKCHVVFDHQTDNPMSCQTIANYNKHEIM